MFFRPSRPCPTPPPGPAPFPPTRQPSHVSPPSGSVKRVLSRKGSKEQSEGSEKQVPGSETNPRGQKSRFGGQKNKVGGQQNGLLLKRPQTKKATMLIPDTAFAAWHCPYPVSGCCLAFPQSCLQRLLCGLPLSCLQRLLCGLAPSLFTALAVAWLGLYPDCNACMLFTALAVWLCPSAVYSTGCAT